MVAGLNIYGGYQSKRVAGSSFSSLASGERNAINGGVNTALYTEWAGLTGRFLNLTGPSFTIDTSLGVPTSDTLIISSSGSVGQSAAIAASQGNVLLIGTGATYTFTLPPNNFNNYFGTLAVNDPAGTAGKFCRQRQCFDRQRRGINGVTVGTLNLSFATGMGVSQSQPLIAGNVSISSGGTNTQTLNNASNSIGTFAASVGASGTVRYYDSTALAIGSVNSINGVTAGTLNLGFAGGIGVTQTQAIKTAANLSLSGSGGTYTLTNTSNNIATFAASVGASDTISLYDSAPLAIGTVNAINGVTAGTLNLSFAAGKGATQSQAISVGDLSVSGSGGTYTLTNGSNSIGAVAASDATGTLSLYDTGTVTQSAAISLANLALLGSSATYTLTGSSNSVGTLAANAGSVSFTDSTALTIGTIGTTSGITATGAVTLTTTGGSSNVTITGAISDSTGAFTIAGGNNISDTSSVNVGSFTLAGGNWLQNYATLTAADSSVFSATNFVISGGTFLRTVGSGENGTTVPYQLFDVYGLQGIATELATNFVLAQTINAGGTVNWNGGAGFAPIGNYQGTLNGQGYSITNLVIDQPSAYSVGMFIFNSGTIENISLTAESITAQGNVGGLVGENFGTISNVSTSGSVSGAGGDYIGGLVGTNYGAISNSSSSATVAGTIVGGLVGDNENSITGSSASGSVSGSVYLGGLVGLNDTNATITSSQASGTVTDPANAGGGSPAGGLVGINYGTISGSSASGDVVGSTLDADQNNDIGGLVGSNQSSGAVASSFATGTVSGLNYIGGLIGINYGSATSSYATGAVNGPSPSTQDLSSGSIGGLVGFQAGGSITGSYATGPVSGTTNVGGLVGSAAGGTGISNSYSTSTVSGYFQVGGLVGQAYGGIPIYNSFAGGSVTGALEVGGFAGVSSTALHEDFATGNVVSTGGYATVGGFIGQNTGTIVNAYASGSATAAANCACYVGGFAGDNDGTRASVYAVGPVSAPGSAAVGALIGGNGLLTTSGVTVTNGYWNTDITGLPGSGGLPGIGYNPGNLPVTIQGMNTAALQAALPTGFSTSYWGIIPNESYPYLLWQPTISGTVYATYGGTTLAGVTVSDIVNGVAGSYTVTSGANGTYTFLLNGSLPSGSNVVAYIFGSTNGVSYQQGAAGTVGGLNIYGTYLSETTAGTTASGLASGLATAIGGYPALQAEVAGLPNLAINATGANFTIDQTLNAGTLVLSSAGAVSQSAALTAANLALGGSGTSYTLTNASNAIGTLAASVGTATVSLADTVNLGIGSVTGASGVTAATLNLSFASGQGVTQSQPIAVSSLSLSGSGGTYGVTNSSNSIGALAASDATGNAQSL